MTEVGEITLRVRDDYQDPMHQGTKIIFLDESAEVYDLYVERETFFKMGAIPEQALSKLAPWKRNLLASKSTTKLSQKIGTNGKRS
eukprot:snap_masked-scaffold_2-processed-gene-12.46-mRNA-1 protein AED:1.00 eAED:1.00 QI:0/-1/0/0/-1/1/1/0/85